MASTRPASLLRLILVSTLLALVIGPLTQVLRPETADAAAFRYWGFYQWTDGHWAFATKGPDSVVPKDGAVDGWRYAVAGEKTPPRLPRAAGRFDRICASTPAKSGSKRVAVVLDYGLGAEAPGGAEPPAPRGACARVPTDATSGEVLAEVAKTRLQKGMVCGIDGYPATGCSEAVKTDPTVSSPEPTVALSLPTAGDQADRPAADQTGDGALQPWTIGVLVVVAGLLVAGLLVRRRRSPDR